MFHIAAYSASVDQAALAAIAAIADPVLTVSGNNIQVPSYASMLGAAFGIGVNLTRLQLQSPSLRRVLNYEVRPMNYLATPSTPPPFVDFMTDPLQLDAGEQLQAWTAEDGAGATRMNAFVTFIDKAVEPVNEPVYPVRATASQTLVAFGWTNGVLTFDQVLPVGQYAIVGARAESAGLLAFRFVLQNQTARPGGLGVIATSGINLPGQRNGGWGVWGTFDNWTLPTIDFFSSSADTAEIVTLDLVKVG